MKYKEAYLEKILSWNIFFYKCSDQKRQEKINIFCPSEKNRDMFYSQNKILTFVLNKACPVWKWKYSYFLKYVIIMTN